MDRGAGAQGSTRCVRVLDIISRALSDSAALIRLPLAAYLINTFLSTTSTQLTYPGLSALCTSPSLLPPSGLAALFRNSHLSVLYRRPTLPSTISTVAAGTGPELFTLVTDAAFAREEGVVWESLEDVDGAECAFFDAALRRSSVRGGDWVGSGGSGGGRASRDERVEPEEGAHDAAECVSLSLPLALQGRSTALTLSLCLAVSPSRSSFKRRRTPTSAASSSGPEPRTPRAPPLARLRPPRRLSPLSHTRRRPQDGRTARRRARRHRRAEEERRGRGGS